MGRAGWGTRIPNPWDAIKRKLMNEGAKNKAYDSDVDGVLDLAAIPDILTGKNADKLDFLHAKDIFSVFSRPTAWTLPIDTITYDFTGFLGRLLDDTLIHIYRVGSEHISSDGKIVMRKSTDDGITWSTPVTIYDSELDDRNPAGGVTPDGAIIVAIGRYDAGNSMWIDWGWIRSEDGGDTWSPYQTFQAAELSAYSPHGPLIVIPELNKVGVTLYELETEAGRIKIAWSDDDGKTFTVQTVLSSTYRVDEPVCVYLGDGRLLLLFENTDESFTIYQMTSEDYGQTWSEPQATNLMKGKAPAIITDSDKIMLLYSETTTGSRYLTVAYADVDEVFADPTTWYDNYMIKSVVGGGAGYPSVVGLNDGTLLVGYCTEASDTDTDIKYRYMPPLPKKTGRLFFDETSGIMWIDNGRRWKVAPQYMKKLVETSSMKWLLNSADKVEAVSGNITATVPEMTIVGGSNTDTGLSWIYWDLPESATRVYIKARLAVVDAQYIDIDLCKDSASRWNNPPDFYHFYISLSTNTFMLEKLVGGTATLLAKAGTVTADTFYDVEIFRDCSTGEIKVWVDGALLFNAIDTDITNIASVRIAVYDDSTTAATSGKVRGPVVIVYE